MKPGGRLTKLWSFTWVHFPVVVFFLSFLNSGELPAFQRCVKHTKIFSSLVLTQVELLLKSDFPDLDTKVCFKVWTDFEGGKIVAVAAGPSSKGSNFPA